ncbi:hypothetical protein CHS0354_006012 [Potamilus streckersoni]|uniref:Uncharacterized protein n=1 Tax=Potamilus streckersoni TaxID=2493646 RepID=A0AAE0RNY5_9BIVA|nr:hypothetical protein CHS0354_006012 [Potamilus streckersoni]
MAEADSVSRFDCDLEYDFQGRSNELERLMSGWHECKRIFILSGFKSIGKTRLAEQFIRNLPGKTVKYALDFRKHCIEDMITFERQFLDLTKAKNKHPLKDGHGFKDWLETLIQIIEDSAFIHLFYFDNIEDILHKEKDLADKFLGFISSFIRKTRMVRIILTSTITIHFAKLGPISHNQRVLKLTLEDSIALLKSVCQGKDLDKYTLPLVKLCEGLPLAIIMTGCELSDPDGFISPIEMVEILICNRLHALSREFYPAEDRIKSVFKNHILKQPELFQQRISDLCSIPGKAIELDRVQEQVGEGMPLSMIKTNILKPMLDRNMVDWDPLNERLLLQGLLKDYFLVKDALQDLPGEADTDDDKKDKLLDFIKENMELLGMNSEAVESLYEENHNVLQQEIQKFFEEDDYDAVEFDE